MFRAIFCMLMLVLVFNPFMYLEVPYNVSFLGHIGWGAASGLLVWFVMGRPSNDELNW